jgi:hypothetical protein
MTECTPGTTTVMNGKTYLCVEGQWLPMPDHLPDGEPDFVGFQAPPNLPPVKLIASQAELTDLLDNDQILQAIDAPGVEVRLVRVDRIQSRGDLERLVAADDIKQTVASSSADVEITFVTPTSDHREPEHG